MKNLHAHHSVLMALSLLLANLVIVGGAIAGTTTRWDAADGLLPDQSFPAWTLFDDAEPEDPVLGATFLTLSTDVENENVYFVRSDSDVSISDPIVIETRLRVSASSASSPAKAAVTIAATLFDSFGNGLNVGIDEIFVLSANNVKGPSASVDTNGQFHTYRIEADFAGNFDVYYDGVLTLEGTSFANASANGTVPRVIWGLLSSSSTGTAEFEYMEHNAGVPAVPALGGLGVALVVVVLALAALGWSRRGVARDS